MGYKHKLPRSIARLRAGNLSNAPESVPAGMGFSARTIRPETPPEPRKVPFGFSPGMTTTQITIAR